MVPVTGGGHRILDLAGTEWVRCGNENQDESQASEGVGLRGLGLAAAEAQAATETPIDELDVLMVYTREASEGAGGEAGMRALLDLSVAEANDAFLRSEVGVRLRIVGWKEVAYTESGDLSLDLSRLGRAGDGWMDEVQVWRDAHAADVVCLVTERESSNQYAGMANQLRGMDSSSLSRGFTVCLRPYLLGNYTLAHEVGHLLGGNHDRDTSPEGGLRPGSYGFRFTVDGEVYRTVMAYRPGVQVPHFSNPRVLFRGVPTGESGVADNAATLNWVAPHLAGVREPAGRVGFVESSARVRESDGSVVLRWTGRGTAPPGQVRIRTQDGTARAGVDYEALDRWMPLRADGEEVEVLITIRNTSIADGTRDFWVMIESAPTGWGVGPGAALPVTIEDDEVSPAVLLDTSFKPGVGTDHAVRALAVGAQDAVIIGGSFSGYDGAIRPRLAKVSNEGVLDAGFASKVKYQVNAVVPLADGRIAIGGDFNTVNDVRMNHVAVLNSDGSLDSGFGFEVGTDLPVHAMVSAPGDRLVVGGSFTSVQGIAALRVARLMTNGILDTTFDTRSGADGDVEALALDAQGRVWMGGRFVRVGGQSRGRIARLETSGRLDAGFGTGPGTDGPVLAMALDGQGRAVVAGDFARMDGRPSGRIARLTPAGRRDESFRGEAGEGADDVIHGVCVRADGRVWIVGRFTRFDGVPRRRVARLLDDGRLDTTFDPGWGPNDWVLAVGERSDGGVVLGGVFTEVMGVSRSGVAVLMPENPGPVRLTEAGMDAGGFWWRGKGWPRQTYAIERSTGFGYWHREGVVRTDTGGLEGVLPVSEAKAGFVRLRRIVQ